ncbi:hypothetical protein EEB11_17925 [Pseudotabrizicola sediminis]|uniref:Uncharacterized protein n=1 Tax=Pseudotabrizicola sediminis TaxID=2486418 RepID=A0ABY2KI70_9RHOB|nr:hypothetical protein [Pseudotabrizicola sediminis]TGD41579.1 hypothetical protein EEB11_17925 [Pseudotabrizicola sediminis]
MITSEEALERSSGRILLHYGEGYSVYDLQSLVRRLAALELLVEVYPGGTLERVEMYFFNNRIPKIFEFSESTEIVFLAESFAERYNLGKFEDEDQ